jgi:predicted dehydrogenase
MKQLIEEGYIGPVCICEARIHCGSFLKDTFDWMCDEVMGGGVLNMHGSVLIDLITFLTGKRASTVHGMLKTYTRQTDKINGIRQITSDDFCSFQMELGGGTCATVIVNNHLPGQYSQEVLICGSKGRLVVRGSDLFAQRLDQSREELLYRDTPNILDRQKTGVSESIGANIPIPQMKGLIKLIDSVKEAFKCGEDKHSWTKEPVAFAATFEDGQYVQTVVDAVRKSSKSREWVKVQVLAEEPDPNPFLSAAMRRSTFSLY